MASGSHRWSDAAVRGRAIEPALALDLNCSMGCRPSAKTGLNLYLGYRIRLARFRSLIGTIGLVG